MTSTLTATSTSSRIEEGPDGTLEIWSLSPTEDVLLRLLTELFEHHWSEITFGPLIQGAAWEVRAPGAPKKIGMFDGYVTVDFGPWHFHLCIGETRGTRSHPTPPELSAHRRTARAEFYRNLASRDGAPTSWGLRFFNGHDEQQMTVFLPNPFLSPEMRILKTPEWSHLELWDRLRQDYLGLAPDPRDRTGKGFAHS